jgi:hypothetical protein
MQHVVVQPPAVAYAVRCLPLTDQLEPTLELLQQEVRPEFAEPERLPPNVVHFRRRTPRC